MMRSISRPGWVCKGSKRSPVAGGAAFVKDILRHGVLCDFWWKAVRALILKMALYSFVLPELYIYMS